MKQYRFSTRSWNNMVDVDPRLVAIASRALLYSPIDFVVIDGLRTLGEQQELVNAGASWTLKSKHLDGRAIDFAAWFQGTVRWEHSFYKQIAPAFKSAAQELNVPIIWGGDWPDKLDMGHIELA